MTNKLTIARIEMKLILDPCWNNGQCDSRSSCTLVETEPDGFNCPCHGDLVGDGRWTIGCSCPQGYGLSEDDDTICVNLDECALQIDECEKQKGIFSYCVETIGKLIFIKQVLFFVIGTYKCECHDGYHVSSASEKCVDINECQLNTDDCHPVAICSNFEGSFDCLCPSGYEGDGHGAVIGCEDVDECYENTHSCQENQFCVNQLGNHV